MTAKEEMIKYLPMIHSDLSPYCVWDKGLGCYIIFDDNTNPVSSKKYGGREFKSASMAWKALKHVYRKELAEMKSCL